MRIHAFALTALLLTSLLPGARALAGDPQQGDAPQGEGKKDDAKPEQPKPGEPQKEAGGGGEAEDPKQKAREERRKRQEEAQKARELRRNGGRDLAPDEPEAQALAQLLAIDARYAKDGTVALLYDFKAAEQIADFERRGFDAAEREQGFGPGRGRAKRMVDAGAKARTRLELAAGSSGGGGVLLHKLDLEDEFTVRFTLQVMRMTGRSDLVLFVGKGGVRFGSQLVVKSGTGFRPLGKGPLGREPFEKGSLEVTLTAKDGELKVAVDGVTTATTDKLKGKLDGPVGLYARDMLLYVYEVEVKGRVDANKLVKKAK